MCFSNPSVIYQRLMGKSVTVICLCVSCISLTVGKQLCDNTKDVVSHSQIEQLKAFSTLHCTTIETSLMNDGATIAGKD